MGLGSTAKKLQRVTDLAEELYERLADLREQILALRNTVDDTRERVTAIETELDRQRVLLEAVAREQGLDPEAILEETVIDEPEATESDPETPATATPEDAS